MDQKEALSLGKEILFKNINLEGIAVDLLDAALEPALKKIVADTTNPFDDMMFATVYPLLEKELKELIAKEVAKLKA